MHSTKLLWTGDRPVSEAATYAKHNIYKKQTFKPPAGFKLAITAIGQPQTYVCSIYAVEILLLSNLNTKNNRNLQHFFLTEQNVYERRKG
jgi:hypothetical protein